MSIFSPADTMSGILADKEYNRQRTSPDHKDEYYIHLSDLLIFLENYKDEQFENILDYGCGGSPYRNLFNAKNFVRADYIDGQNIDVTIKEDGQVALPSNSFDVILSTQVLEHVRLPSVYLKEAFRLLKPGGKIILTAPGIWEDHGCPHDFHRWTYDGLILELESIGFKVNKVARMSTGARAILFLFAKIMYQLQDSSMSLPGIAFKILRHSKFANIKYRHFWIDQLFSKNRVVYGDNADHGIYLNIGVEAIKKEE